MKRKYVYLLALSALTLGACSNEDGLFGGAPDGGPKQQVTFLFPGTAQGVVPYAGIASEAENKIKTLDVYVFGADKLATSAPKYLLEDVVSLKDTELTGTGDDLKATLSIVGTNDKCLYFVANGGDQTALNDYELGVTDTLAFVNKQTRHMGKGLIKAPLLMTGRYMFKAAADGGMDLTGPHPVVLNRRVARFDIINNAEESSLEIEKILIKAARPGTYLFGFGDTARPDYAEATVAELMEIDFLAFPSANVGTTGSVFYVYPTMVDGETSFQLKGRSTQSGEQMVQPVKMQLKQTGTTDETKMLPISANTRYIINVLAAGMANINATITVKEWLVGENVDVEAGFGLVKMTLPTPVTGVALTESKKLTVPSGAIAAFDIAVQADTEWEIVEKDNELAWIALTNRPVAGTVAKKFSLEVNEANPSSEPREQVLHIRNVKRPSVVQTLTVVQAGNAAGFKVEGDRLDNGTLMLFGVAGKTTLNVTLPGGVTTFDCEVAGADNWITLAKPAVSRAVETIDGSQLAVTVEANPGISERAGSFKIIVGGIEQTIIVRQSPQNLGSIVVKATGLTSGVLNCKGTAQIGLSLLVTALTEWEVKAVDIDATGAATGTTSWVTDGSIVFNAQDPKPNYNGRYNFNLEANTAFEERKSQITLSNKLDPTIKSVITLIQEGKPETLSLTGGGEYASDVLLFAANATAGIDLTVTTDNTSGTVENLTVTKEGAADWFEVTASGSTITVTPTAHTGFSLRSATVTVKMEGAADKKFTVKQEGVVRPTFTVSGSGLSNNALAITDAAFDAETFTVAPSNNAFDALSIVKQENTDWLTLVSTSLAADGTFTLAATANDAADAPVRTATITITLADAETPTVITVTQAAAATQP